MSTQPISAARLVANRRNAQKSTGPRTLEASPHALPADPEAPNFPDKQTQPATQTSQINPIPPPPVARTASSGGLQPDVRWCEASSSANLEDTPPRRSTLSGLPPHEIR